MDRAAQLASATSPHPNPRVGAVIVARDGSWISEGAHHGPGTAHAEAAALAAAGEHARGATVYVTLEPCSHKGRTPPCVDQLIAAGVGAVVVGARDPDARVDGRGIAALNEAGIAVSVHPGDDLESVDPGYFHHRRTGRPRVVLKTAATIDGQVAAADGTSQWITSPEARADAHRLRAAADAVLIGAGTLRTDDPELTVRPAPEGDRQPRPVVVAGATRLPSQRRLYARDPILYVPSAASQTPAGGTVVVAGHSPSTVDLETMLDDLGRRGVVDLLVEGGPTVAAAFLDQGLIDHLVVYLGAKLAGGAGAAMFTDAFATIADARPVTLEGMRRVGPDLRLDLTIERQDPTP